MALNSGVNYGLEKAKEVLTKEFQTMTSGMLEKGQWTAECCKRIIVLNDLQLTNTTIELHEELEKALHPRSRSNQLVTTLWAALNKVGDYFTSKSGKGMMGSLIQGYNYVAESTKIHRELMLQAPRLNKAI